MSKKAAPTDFSFKALVELCRRTHEELRSRAIRSVDIAMVVRNWLIGWYIVEYEQTGADRAQYGSRLIERLAAKLHLKGSSATNLRKFRQFYREYPIQQTLSVESGKAPSAPLNWQTVSVELFQRFSLNWSHYVTLLSIDNPEERRFYEIEAREGSWGSRNLERQISSSLYERLALSRDKEEIRRLSQKGQTVEKAADIIKNPLVLEFLGLEEKPRYSEEELGQMQMYVNYFDHHVKTEDELPTIGIVLCHRKNDALVELTLPKEANIFASKYQLYLPSKEVLKAQLEKIEAELKEENGE